MQNLANNIKTLSDQIAKYGFRKTVYVDGAKSFTLSQGGDKPISCLLMTYQNLYLLNFANRTSINVDIIVEGDTGRTARASNNVLRLTSTNREWIILSGEEIALTEVS